jgi:hypothetical protein
MDSDIYSNLEPFYNVCIICTVITILFSGGLIFLLKKKTSNYAWILRHVVMSETIFLFSLCLVTIDAIVDPFIDFACSVLKWSTFNIISDDCYYIKVVNKATFYALEIFSIWLNFFICLEIIFILKNPISQLQTRLRYYFITGLLAGTANFVLVCALYHEKTNEAKRFSAYIPK